MSFSWSKIVSACDNLILKLSHDETKITLEAEEKQNQNFFTKTGSNQI